MQSKPGLARPNHGRIKGSDGPKLQSPNLQVQSPNLQTHHSHCVAKTYFLAMEVESILIDIISFGQISAISENLQAFKNSLQDLLKVSKEKQSLFFSAPSLVDALHILNELIVLPCESNHSILELVIDAWEALTKSTAIQNYAQLVLQTHVQLLKFLEFSLLAPTSSLLAKCLRLLAVITKDCRVLHVDSSCSKVVLNMVDLIGNSNLSTVALHILSNLCGRNPCIQEFIHQKVSTKSFWNDLLPNINSSNHAKMIYSLRILRNVNLDNSITGQLFSNAHLIEILELVIKEIAEDQTNHLAYDAVNLFIDLTSETTVLSFYLSYAKIDSALSKVKKVYSSGLPAKHITSILKFLNVFASIPKETIDQDIYKNIFFDGFEDFNYDFLPILLDISVLKVHDYDLAPCYAMEIMRKAIEFCLEQKSFNWVSSYPKIEQLLDILPVSLGCNSLYFDTELITLLALFDLLHTIQMNCELIQTIDENTNIEKLTMLTYSLINIHFLTWKKGLYSDIGSITVISSVIFISSIKNADARTLAQNIWKNKRFSALFSHAFYSGKKENVYRCLCSVKSAKEYLNISQIASLFQTTFSQEIYTDDDSYFMPPSYDQEHEKLNLVAKFDHLIIELKEKLNLSDGDFSEAFQYFERQILSLKKKEKELVGFLKENSSAHQKFKEVLNEYKSWEDQNCNNFCNIQESLFEKASAKVEKKLEVSLSTYHAVKKELEETKEEMNNLSNEQAALQKLTKGQSETLQELNANTSGVTNANKNLVSVMQEKDGIINQLNEDNENKADFGKKVEDCIIQFKEENSTLKNENENAQNVNEELQQKIAALEEQREMQKVTLTKSNSLAKELEKKSHELKDLQSMVWQEKS